MRPPFVVEAGNGILEIEVQGHLNLSWAADGVGYDAEAARATVEAAGDSALA